MINKLVSCSSNTLGSFGSFEATLVQCSVNAGVKPSETAILDVAVASSPELLNRLRRRIVALDSLP